MVGAKEDLKQDYIITNPKTLDNLVENENPYHPITKISKSHGEYDRVIVGYALAKAALDSAEDKSYWAVSIKSRLDEMRRFTGNLEIVYKAGNYKEVLDEWSSDIKSKLSAFEETLKAYGRRRIAPIIKEVLEERDVEEMLTEVGFEVIKAIRGMRIDGRIHRPYKQRNSVNSPYVPPQELRKILLEQERIIRERLGNYITTKYERN